MKKYQVFVSSTYEDLKEEREKLVYALMKADHIPECMEMFTAAPASSWDVIRKKIDNSDYYILIIGFKYGSLAKDGISYTEKEYDYAKSKGIPILSFIQDREVPIPKSKRETNPDNQEKLDKFIKKAKENQIVFWRDCAELENNVITALSKDLNESSKSRIGWYRFKPEATILLQDANEQYVFINALSDKTAQEMRKDAENRAEYKGKFVDGINTRYWDIVEMLGGVTSIETEHVKPILEYLKMKKADLSGVQHAYFFYAGPASLPFHIGYIFANSATHIEIIQCTKGNYSSLGVLSK